MANDAWYPNRTAAGTVVNDSGCRTIYNTPGWSGYHVHQDFIPPVSNTLEKHEWKNSVFIKGDVVEQIKKLKGDDGPNVQVYGSGNLVQTLLKHDLVDELWLKTFPITLGIGKRLFVKGTIPEAFKLLSSQVSPSGVIIANYERAGEVKTGAF